MWQETARLRDTWAPYVVVSVGHDRFQLDGEWADAMSKLTETISKGV
jgi:hypothetical protein